jgi:hypothetical protein
MSNTGKRVNIKDIIALNDVLAGGDTTTLSDLCRDELVALQKTIGKLLTAERKVDSNDQ